jgi:DNA invertase Pin-like site-specific DNA recombinase
MTTMTKASDLLAAVLVTEVSRWGRSTLDLLHTLQELEARHVSLIARSGLAFDLSTPHRRMLATVIAGIASSSAS